MEARAARGMQQTFGRLSPRSFGTPAGHFTHTRAPHYKYSVNHPRKTYYGPYLAYLASSASSTPEPQRRRPCIPHILGYLREGLGSLGFRVFPCVIGSLWEGFRV